MPLDNSHLPPEICVLKVGNPCSILFPASSESSDIHFPQFEMLSRIMFFQSLHLNGKIPLLVEPPARIKKGRHREN